MNLGAPGPASETRESTNLCARKAARHSLAASFSAFRKIHPLPSLLNTSRPPSLVPQHHEDKDDQQSDHQEAHHCQQRQHPLWHSSRGRCGRRCWRRRRLKRKCGWRKMRRSRRCKVRCCPGRRCGHGRFGHLRHCRPCGRRAGRWNSRSKRRGRSARPTLQVAQRRAGDDARELTRSARGHGRRSSRPGQHRRRGRWHGWSGHGRLRIKRRSRRERRRHGCWRCECRWCRRCGLLRKCPQELRESACGWWSGRRRRRREDRLRHLLFRLLI